MKRFLFYGIWAMLIGAIAWTVNVLFLLELNDLDQKLFSIRMHVQWLVVLGLYIAWRVTPE